MAETTKIGDVARLARVSPSTVSNVLNGRHDRMRPETRERVRQAIAQLGYAPSQYWRMAGHNALVAAGERVYALAEPGRQYVVYAAVGGAFSLDLAPGPYTARRYDPRTGEDTPLAGVSGGGPRSFAAPDGDDWVVYLSRSRT